MKNINEKHMFRCFLKQMFGIFCSDFANIAFYNTERPFFVFDVLKVKEIEILVCSDRNFIFKQQL